MNRLVFLSCIILLSVFLANCGRRAPEPAPSDEVEDRWIEKVVDTVATKDKPFKEEPVEKRNLMSNSSPNSSNNVSITMDKSVTYSSNRNNDGYDNMRGFDPASEDDMDDNGMSRYMENNDEEGWD